MIRTSPGFRVAHTPAGWVVGRADGTIGRPTLPAALAAYAAGRGARARLRYLLRAHPAHRPPALPGLAPRAALGLPPRTAPDA